MLKKNKAVKDDPNPWLNIEHDHNWLSASDGKELVCGDCSIRKPATINSTN